MDFWVAGLWRELRVVPLSFISKEAADVIWAYD